MEKLAAIFGSETRVKLMRLFLFNPEGVFPQKDLGKRTKSRPPSIRSELRSLEKAGIAKKRGKSGYSLDQSFPYLDQLKGLLTVSSVTADQSMVKRFAKAGKIKLLVAAGVFIQSWDSRVDLLIVGDGLSLPKIESAIRDIEAELGKEIAYSAFETQDFEYRMAIHDRLARDVMDYPHVTLLDRLGVEPQ